MKFLNNIFKILKKDRSNQKIDDLIVSLTSYPDRINIVHKVVESLLNQTIKPEKIILWLADGQFPNKENDLPKELLDLRNDIFEIDWCDDIRSYKKLIPTLKKYPDSAIVTCDDDIIYENDRLERLYKVHKKYPSDIVCHRAHYILLNKNKQIKPYEEWDFECFGELYSYNVFPTTGAMALYPPNSFYKDVLNNDIFMSICEDTDDIWFWAMAVLNNKKLRLIKNNINIIDSVQDKALYKTNIYDGKNDENLRKIIDKYIIILSKLTPKKPIRILDEFFSIRYKQQHKIITILGIKIKLRSKNDKS